MNCKFLQKTLQKLREDPCTSKHKRAALDDVAHIIGNTEFYRGSRTIVDSFSPLYVFFRIVESDQSLGGFIFSTIPLIRRVILSRVEQAEGTDFAIYRGVLAVLDV